MSNSSQVWPGGVEWTGYTVEGDCVCKSEVMLFDAQLRFQYLNLNCFSMGWRVLDSEDLRDPYRRAPQSTLC